MHNRQRMRISNRKVVEKLILDGYDDIWLKPHTARNDTVYTQERKYLATDLWNLFDVRSLTLPKHTIYTGLGKLSDSGILKRKA